MSKTMIAMILAGGQGTRLGKLTKETAKPAVPFGGRYRIIDFTLSNCFNSRVYEVGVVTQYQPLELNEHIGNGSPWGLNRRNDSVKILQPYSSADGNRWFEGTANAIYQNIGYIDTQNPKYILILSGDHIYKMNYLKMLESHIENDAELTVAVLDVPLEEASRFGIMATDENLKITEFQEKPEKPKSTLASMGIYIFNWATLRSYLVEDQNNKQELMDFGKHVIPKYLEEDRSIYAYPFEGYWKDVGTIESLWEANMEFLDPNHTLNISDPSWRVYTRARAYPPQTLTANSSVKNSMLVDGCYIDGHIKNAMISQNVTINKDAVVEDSVIMTGAKIGANASVKYAIVGEYALIDDGAVVHGTKDNIKVIGYEEHVKGEAA